MTLGHERFNAIAAARDLLTGLIDPEKTPRVPHDVRMRALACLRHYPTPLDMEGTAVKAPDIWSAR